MKRYNLFGAILSVFMLTALIFTGCTSSSPTSQPTTTVTTTVTATSPGGAATSTTPTAAAKTYTFRVNVPYPLNLAILPVIPFKTNGRFAALVNEYTNGAVKLEAKEMLYAEDTLYAVGDGRIELGESMVPDFSGTLPLADFTSLPGLFSPFPDGLYEAEAAINDSRMMVIMEQMYRTQGAVPLGSQFGGPQVLWSLKPVSTVADWKGLKARTSGLIQANMVKAMGGNPIIVTDVEVDQLLIRKTVDAAITDIPYGSAIGLLDLVTNVCLWEVSPNMQGTIFMNAKQYDALPKDLQEAMKRAGREVGAQINLGEELGTGYLMNWLGSKVVTPSKTELDKTGPMLKSVYEEWLKIAGPNGKEVLAIAGKYGKGAGVQTALSLTK